MEDNGMRNIDPSLGGSGMSQVAAGSPLENPLFLERLEVFYEKGLADLRAFAQREACPFDEVRKRVAEWHCKSLFASSVLDINAKPKNKETAAEILKSISSQLEALQSLLGLESFYLAVNPHDPADDGFLGGTLLGREFWRGHRGCGAPGAKAFQLFCQKAGQTLAPTPQHGSAALHSPLPSAPPPTYPPAPHIPQQAASTSTSVQSAGNASVKKGPASTVKAEVYVTVRNAIRAASGHRNAEMKWSNHARLSAFDVELLGWPPAVPMRNPSALSTAQNQAILDAMKNGSMYFRSTKPPGMPSTSEVPSERPQQQTKHQTQRAETEECEKDIFDDAIDFLGSLGRLEERTRELTAPPPVAEDSSKAVQSSNDSEDEASVSLLRFEDLHDDSYDPFDMDFIREDPIDVPPRKRKRNDSTDGNQPSPDPLP